MMNKPVAWMMVNRENTSAYLTFDKPTRDMKISHEPHELYTHPVKENYMNEVLNNTLNMEKNHNEKAYKELYEVCVKQQSEIEALKAHPVKELMDEEIIEVHINTPFIDGYLNKNLIEFARAILRKAQEK